MKRGFFLLFGAFLFVAGAARAQDASVQDDMRFVEELRKQGKSDLALEFLQRLAKNPSPDLQKQLPLEMARTRLGAAGEEPDSGKRLALYAAAREEFDKWLKDNPGDPRAGEVKLDVAQVAVLQGRTQLSLAMMNPDFDEVMVPEAFKARAMLEDAKAQVAAAAQNIDEQLAKLGDPKTPAEKDLKKKLESDKLQAELNADLNQFDVAMTYPRDAKDNDNPDGLAQTRAKKMAEAQKAFETLAAKDEQNPICWVAKAWAGRCLHENGEGPKARARYKDILNADKHIAAEAQRLARYFNLLVVQEKPEGKEDDNYILDEGNKWLTEYHGYLNTPEGYGLRFLLAETYWTLYRNPMADASRKAAYLTDARKLLRQVESSENDFTDRARRLKIEVIATQQGGFKTPIDQLRTFEDCYVRAQFEQMQQAKDDKESKPEDQARRHEEHDSIITAALQRGLKLAAESKSAQADDAMDLGNAKAMLAFEYMNAKRYRDAIAVARPFAENDPRTTQAAAAAVYALQCYAEMVSAEEANGDKPEDVKKDRDSLLKFASFMEKSWPKETPGDMARHQLSLLYINDKDPDKHEENVQKAIESLQSISPTYGNYTVTQYQLAQYCFKADEEKLKPLPGDGEDGYRKRALAALENVPALAAGADMTTNRVYFLAKVKLAQEDFKLKRFAEMEKLTDALTPLIAKVPLDADKAADEKLRGEFAESIKGFRLYARWAEADAEAKAAEKADAKERPAHFTKVTELLDPIVDEIQAGQHEELKNNPQLARGILDNDLRAAIQLNKLDRAQAILNSYKSLASGDAADAGAAEVLKQLVVFIPPQLDELKHKGDAAALEAAKKKFGEILADTIKPLTGDKLTPKLVYFTAKIYSSMDKHKEAADLLAKFPVPASGAPPTEADLYQMSQVMLVRELRLDNQMEEARKLMDAIMGTTKAPGWGAKKIDVLMENVYRQAVKLKDKSAEKYAAEVKTAATLAAGLARKQPGFGSEAARVRFRDLMDAEPDLKEAFLSAYLTTAEADAKKADALKDKAQRDRAMSDLATQVMELEKTWPDDGGDAAKTRVNALLGADADLKAAYDQLKGSAAAP